jgi:3-methyladenine DNA glycosylase AlkD
MNAADVKAALQKYANTDDAVFLQRFFKTGPGQYGEGDVFIGVRVPATRQVCRQFKDLPLAEVQKLLNSPVHEHRLAAVILLANKYPRANAAEQQAIYDLYLKNVYAGRVNNWDIVDISCAELIGAHVADGSHAVLYKLARSNDVWQKRVAIISTFYFLRHGDASTSLDMADILLHDPHDLIQKAVGWTLREAGKRTEQKILTDFLDKHAHDMPRTALRYAIEHLSTEQKRHYMHLKQVYNDGVNGGTADD